MSVADEQAGDELLLYLENDADIYRRRLQPIFKNLVTKMARGTYNSTAAVRAFRYAAEDAAKKYAKEYATPSEWSSIFNPATRTYVAVSLRDSFETEARLGNYDSMLPKKYQVRNPSRKARRFISRTAKREIRAGYPQKQAVAIAYSEARRKGYKVPKKRKRRKNSTVHVPFGFASNPANPGSKWHLAQARGIISNFGRLKTDKERHYHLGALGAHLNSAGNDPGSTSADFAEQKRLTKVLKEKRSKNPRRHVPKLPKRGRPVRQRTFKYKLYDRRGVHVATKSEKTSYDKAKAHANRMKRGSFRGRKIAKIVMEW